MDLLQSTCKLFKINDNRVYNTYKTRASEPNNIERFGTKTENFNHFLLSVLMNGVNY